MIEEADLKIVDLFFYIDGHFSADASELDE